MITSDRSAKSDLLPPQFAQIPGNWNDLLQPRQDTPYGYGSYRLRILLPEEEQTFSVYVPSVRSASQLYVDGQLAASAGTPASESAEYEAHNVPYTATFASSGRSEIEIVIQAANFVDPRGGGSTCGVNDRLIYMVSTIFRYV